MMQLKSTKLSKQEKAILTLIYKKILEDSQSQKYPINIRGLSKNIAKIFNKGNKRIKKHGYNKYLTPSHRASFSRSLRRLEKRGLLIRSNKDGEITKVTHKKTVTVILTKKGIAVCQKLFNLNNQNSAVKNEIKQNGSVPDSESGTEINNEIESNNPYKILEISPQATELEIKKAYKQLAKKYHPDLNKTPEAKEQFIKLNKAYTELTNQEPPSIMDIFTAILGEGFLGWNVNMNDFLDKEEFRKTTSNVVEYLEKLMNSKEHELYQWASNKMNLLRRLYYKVCLDLKRDHYWLIGNPELVPFFIKTIKNVIIHFQKVLNNEVDTKEKIPKPTSIDDDIIDIYQDLSYKLRNQFHPKFLNKFPEKYQLFIREKMREIIYRLKNELKDEKA